MLGWVYNCDVEVIMNLHKPANPGYRKNKYDLHCTPHLIIFKVGYLPVRCLPIIQFYDVVPYSPVLLIRDILMWIRIRIPGSMPLTNGSVFGSGSCYFHH
jgi:hypothetical protein